MSLEPLAKLFGRPSRPSQAAFLTAGWRLARPERRPLGLPGERPQGFGGSAGVPSPGKSAETTRDEPGAVSGGRERSSAPRGAADPRRTAAPSAAA